MLVTDEMVEKAMAILFPLNAAFNKGSHESLKAKTRSALDAAIALMRGQSEVVIRLPELPEQDVEGVRFDGFSISAMEDFARRAVAMNERSCVWTIDADPYAEMWNGACGIAWTFTEGGPADNECNHCPKCGGRIEATEQPKDTADEQ